MKEPVDYDDEEHEADAWCRLFVISCIFTIPVFLITMVLPGFMPVLHEPVFAYPESSVMAPEVPRNFEMSIPTSSSVPTTTGNSYS